MSTENVQTTVYAIIFAYRYFRGLKALFNNVFTLKNMSRMALHAISVFSKV